jgi:isoleucyl-tRNA synthetase
LVNEALIEFGTYIQTETQALKLEITDTLAQSTALEIDDYTLQIQLEVVK